MESIIIKGELPDLNDFINTQRKNRYNGAELKKNATENVMWQTKGISEIQKYPLHIHIQWITKDERKDPDNISFAKKFILDGLVRNKILKNDNRKCILSFSDEFGVDKDNPRIIIKLTCKDK